MNWNYWMGKVFLCAMAIGLMCLAGAARAGKLGPVVPQYDPDKGNVGEVSGSQGMTPSDVVVMDFNLDGFDDLIVSYAFSDEIGMFAGDGAGNFELVETIELTTYEPQKFDDSPRKLLVGDFDQDGFEDLLTINSGYGPFSGAPEVFWTTPTLGIFYGLPIGGFSEMRPIEFLEPNLIEPSKQRLFAFSGAYVNAQYTPGTPEIWIGYAFSNEIETFRRESKGRGYKRSQFKEITTSGFGPYEIIPFQLRGVGPDDVLIVNEHDVQLIYGIFEINPYVIHEGVEMLTAVPSDFDNDGKWDIAILDGGADELVIIWGMGLQGIYDRKSIVQLPPGSGGVAMEPVDANRDGYMDLAILYRNKNKGQVFLSNGHHNTETPGFRPAFQFETSRMPRAMAVVDLNGDRRPDFAVANEGDQSNTDGMDLNNEDIVLAANNIDEVSGNALIGSAGVDPIPIEGLGPRLKSTSGLAWDSSRELLWTIDRVQGTLAGLNHSGELEQSFNLRQVFVGYEDFVDLAIDDDGMFWLLDRSRNRLTGRNLDNNESDTIILPQYDIEYPVSVSWDGQRLVVIDEEGRMARFQKNGEFIDSLRTTVRDVAFDPVLERYLGIYERLGQLTQDVIVSDPLNTNRYYPFEDLAPFLRNRQIKVQWLEIIPVSTDETNKIESSGDQVDLWVITTGGVLARFRLHHDPLEPLLPWKFELKDRFELSLLRDINTITHTSSGNLLLGDAGPLSTVVKLNQHNELIDSYHLNDSRETPYGLTIRSLSSSSKYLFVGNDANLNGVNQDCLVFEGDDGKSGFVEILRLSRAGFIPNTYYFDENTSILYQGNLGKIYRNRVRENEPGSAMRLDGRGSINPDISIPAYMKPSTITAGPRPGTIAVWVPEYETVLIMDPENPDNSTNITRTRSLPLGFRARTGLFPTADGQPGWLAGTGESNLIEFVLEDPANSAQLWQLYQ